MGLSGTGRVWLALLVLALLRPAASPSEELGVNPWRNPDGTLTGDSILLSLVPDAMPPPDAPSAPLTPVSLANGRGGDVGSGMDAGRRAAPTAPRDEFNRFAGSAGALDRGIDSADTKWRRQARITGVRMRMLNGPEANLSWEGVSSDTERGGRAYAGAVVPLNPRWELALLNKFAGFKNLEEGGRAGLDALTVRLGANPSVSFRPWVALTPYAGLWDRDGGGLGVSAGASKNWSSGISLSGEAYAWQPWDEGYSTALHDGRSHGVRLRGTLPVNRRLTLSGEAGYEWLELGHNAPGGSRYAGRRGDALLRVDYRLLKRDDAYMGYGFRDPELWSEQLVPVELGLFADAYCQRYIRPRGFTTLNPTEKSMRERIGVFYYQAVSPRVGLNAEAYVGQDTARKIDAGDLYGATVRLNLVFSPHMRMWAGWGYESNSDDLSGGGGPDRNFSVGLSVNF